MDILTYTGSGARLGCAKVPSSRLHTLCVVYHRGTTDNRHLFSFLHDYRQQFRILVSKGFSRNEIPSNLQEILMGLRQDVGEPIFHYCGTISKVCLIFS